MTYNQFWGERSCDAWKKRKELGPNLVAPATEKPGAPAGTKTAKSFFEEESRKGKGDASRLYPPEAGRTQKTCIGDSLKKNLSL